MLKVHRDSFRPCPPYYLPIWLLGFKIGWYHGCPCTPLPPGPTCLLCQSEARWKKSFLARIFFLDSSFPACCHEHAVRDECTKTTWSIIVFHSMKAKRKSEFTVDSVWINDGITENFWKVILLLIECINGILLPKLFWPTVRKNCSSDWKFLLQILGLHPRISKVFLDQ